MLTSPFCFGGDRLFTPYYTPNLGKSKPPKMKKAGKIFPASAGNKNVKRVELQPSIISFK